MDPQPPPTFRPGLLILEEAAGPTWTWFLVLTQRTQIDLIVLQWAMDEVPPMLGADFGLTFEVAHASTGTHTIRPVETPEAVQGLCLDAGDEVRITVTYPEDTIYGGLPIQVGLVCRLEVPSATLALEERIRRARVGILAAPEEKWTRIVSAMDAEVEAGVERLRARSRPRAEILAYLVEEFDSEAWTNPAVASPRLGWIEAVLAEGAEG